MLNIRGYIWVLCLFLIPSAVTAQSLQRADSLRIRGERLQESGNFKKAETYYKKAFNLYQTHHDTASWLVTGVYYAEVHSYQSEMDKAIKLLNDLKLVVHPANNDSLRARIESDLGWIYKQRGQLGKSLQHLKKGLSYAQKAKDSLMIAVSLNNLAGVYSKKNNYRRTLGYYKKALPIFEDLHSKRSQAYALINIGNFYNDLSLFDKASEYYSRGLQIAKSLENVNLLAHIYDSMGKLQQDLGNYDRALIKMQQSLEYRRQSNNHQEIASTLNTIGTLYHELGKNEKALEYFCQSLAIWRQVSNPYQLAVGYKNVGAVLWDLGKNREAKAHYRRALALKKETGNPRSIATSLLDLSTVNRTEGHYSVAYNHLKQAQAITDSTTNIQLLMRISQRFGHLSYVQHNISDAIYHYKKALNYSQSLQKHLRVAPLKSLARAYKAMESDSALYYGRRAIDLIEQGRTQIGPLSELKAGYFKQHSDFYIDLAAWTIQYENNVSRAYKLIESAKARTLTDELVKAARRIDESLPEGERLKRAKKLAKISNYYSRLKETTDSLSKEKLKDRIRVLELEYASFENKLQQQYPRYKFLESPKPVALQKVQKMCDEETAILEYAISSDQVIGFYITSDQVETKQILTNPGDSTSYQSGLGYQVRQFRKAIVSRAPVDSIYALSQPLYNQLIAPFSEKLVTKENIIIVPDDYLAYLPFEALSNNHNYMVSEFNIKYVPSMTGFLHLAEPGGYNNRNILAIGSSGSYSSAGNTVLLPTVGLEIESIAAQFNKATILRNQEISEHNVKEQIQENYSVVHIAAHSLINEQHSSQSGIILGTTETENGIGNDGYLRSSEIYRLNIPGNMVVLSACKSGIGQMINGEGLLGLQRAFFNAGTSTVVVSLWDVYDRSTTHFMQLFYKSLTEGPANESWGDSWQLFLRWIGWDESVPFGRASSAMRKAKLAMLDHPKYNHPVYWAPFIVVGR